MDTIDKRYLKFKLKLGVSDKNTKNGSSKDRRSGKDRRKISSKKYFLEGGHEKRSWRERRNYWYMTM